MHGVSLNDVAILVTDRRYDTRQFQMNDIVVISVVHQDCNIVAYNVFFQPKVAACFDIITVILLTGNAQKRIASETIHLRDIFINTR